MIFPIFVFFFLYNKKEKQTGLEDTMFYEQVKQEFYQILFKIFITPANVFSQVQATTGFLTVSISNQFESRHKFNG